jgi:HTH-type transcriptional regulator/antitoxin HipB
MIKNQKQAGNVREKLQELNSVKAEYLEKNKSDIGSAKYRLGINSLNGLIEELQEELDVYDSLIKGNFHCFQPKSLEEISDILIGARLAQNMSQKELAEKLGMKEQMIQRYEATDYETAAFHRIVEVAMALGIKFNFEKIELKNSNKATTMFALPDSIKEEKVDAISAKIQNESHILNVA